MRFLTFLKQFWQTLTAPFRMVFRLIFRLPLKLISTPRRVMGLSLPARAALLVAITLVICTITAIIVIYSTGEAADIRNYIFDPKFLAVLVLDVVIPIVVYFWLKLWLEGDISRFPDIDAAWQEGLAALEENRLDLTSVPMFLVLGAPEEQSTTSVFKSSAMNFAVHDVPQGRAPLRWYADEKGVYLVCINASRLSKLHLLGKSVVGPGAAAKPDIKSTLQPSGGLRGTMAAGTALRDSVGPASIGAEPAGEPEAVAGMLRGTLVPGAHGIGGTLPPGVSGAAPSTPTSSALSRQEAENQTERLQYVCELLRRARQPVCPMNGILVLLPFDSVQHVMTAKDIPAAIRSDLETVRRTTKLHCPVTAMVVGMEGEGGFCELVRRVGASRAKAHRFGKGFDVWNPPTEENIDAFSSHACGAFEDWVYSLFRERDGLSKPGNAKLYMLLCKIRSEMRVRLRNILLHGFSFDPTDKRTAETPLLFNGCYFAATGESEDRQAFVKNVFEKMLDLEEELQWSDEALAEDDRYHRLAQFGMFFDGALIVLLIGIFVWKFFVAKGG